MKYYAVIDTNVLVSAMLKWDSVPGNIVKFAFSDIIIPMFNDDIINEYRNVLSRPKFGLDSEIVDNIIDEFVKQGMSVEPKATSVTLPDPKDIVFYEVTMEKRKKDEAYLVTGNIKHFPSEPFIVTPREMLEIILNVEKQ